MQCKLINVYMYLKINELSYQQFSERFFPTEIINEKKKI